MANHTPGPWEVDHEVSADSYFSDVNIVGPDRLSVAVAVQNGDISAAETLANALVLAASLDLLAAAQMIDRMAGKTAHGTSWGVAVAAIRAAIAKAEGQ